LYVRYLYWNDDRWNWNYNWLDNDFNDNNPAACSQLSLFLPHFLREFCFNVCPCQPPSILPTSSNFSERVIYFLLSKHFISHRIIRNILRVSSFLIDNLMYGNFSILARKLAVTIASIVSTNNLSIFSPREYLCVFGNVV